MRLDSTILRDATCHRSTIFIEHDEETRLHYAETRPPTLAPLSLCLAFLQGSRLLWVCLSRILCVRLSSEMTHMLLELDLDCHSSTLITLCGRAEHLMCQSDVQEVQKHAYR
jgi:hypothetical protein